MAQLWTKNTSLYQYKPLIGDDIRLIRLQPGSMPDDLYVAIFHAQLRVRSENKNAISESIVAETLPGSWQSFRTPEGRLFYQDMDDGDSPIQYEHPAPELVPKELLETVNRESQVVNVNPKDAGTQFAALSYAWGNPKPTGVLYVRGEDDEDIVTHIPITANLESALRHLRNDNESRLLWVDAVCINQTDEAEKNEQVHRIPDLYRSAWQVIAWLGEASSDSDLAIKTMQYLGQQIEISQSTWQHPPPDAEEVEWINLDFKLPYSQEQWSALASLMDRPWFKRVWVLQEITLANSNAIVQCGGDVISYYFFRRAVVGLRMRPGIPDSLYERIEEKFTFSYGLQSTGICDLISMAREHNSTTPHDKVYGLLGFIGPKLRQNLQPSYQTPFTQVFKDVFLTHSRSTHRLELLAHCFLIPNSALPSWVPDWRSYGDGAPFIPSATTLSAGMSKAEFREARTGELEVSGVLHGVVTDTFKVMNSKKGDRIGPWIRKLIKGCIKSPTYPTGENIHEAFARLLCRNQLQDRFPEAIHYDTMGEWQETLRKLVKRKGSVKSDDKDLQGFVRSQWGYWEWRRFFRTEHGYLGLGPVDMEAGDHVCVLLGLFCPLVIRPYENNRFKIVGGCYVHGLVDSEALLGPVADPWVVRQHNASGRSLPRYFNTSTDEDTVEDSRLGPIPENWRRVSQELTADDPEHVDFFLNELTGETINYDPRLSKEALEERGVVLHSMTLV